MSLAASCGIIGQRAVQLATQFRAEYSLTAGLSDKEQLLQFIAWCTDNEHPITYLSVPITTGRTYLNYLISVGGRQEGSSAAAARVAARKVNEQQASATAERLRPTLRGILINPSSLVDISGWGQSNYHEFWVAVIHRYAEKMLFLDGWQYSVGCAIEFSTALQLGLPTLTEHLMPMDTHSAIALLREAVNEYARQGLSPELLRRSLRTAESAAAIVGTRGCSSGRA